MAEPPIPCPRCHQTAGVHEQYLSGNPLRWFVCHLCSYVWSVSPAPKTQRASLPSGTGTKSSDIRTLVEEVLSDLALPYRVERVSEPDRDAGCTISFFDPTESAGRQVFEITLRRPDGRDHMKATIAERLLERCSARS